MAFGIARRGNSVGQARSLGYRSDVSGLKVLRR
jgi:hypothetical protein